MKHKKITKEIEEIKREMQASQRSQLAERKVGKQMHTGAIKDDEHKLNAVTTTGEEKERHQHRDQINKLRKKLKARITR
jgi:hypothetical protein